MWRFSIVLNISYDPTAYAAFTKIMPSQKHPNLIRANSFNHNPSPRTEPENIGQGSKYLIHIKQNEQWLIGGVNISILRV